MDSLSQQIQKLTLDKDRAEDKKSRLEEDLAKLEESKKKFEFEIKDTEWRLKELKSESKGSEKEIKAIQNEFISKKNQEEKMAKEALELEAAIKSLTREYNQLKAEKDAAKSLEKGYTGAVNAILESRDRGDIK